MRTVLLALSLLGSIASSPKSAPYGTLSATSGSEHSCAWSVDGMNAGVSSTLDLPLFAGEHTLRCKRLVDGAVSTQVAVVAPNATTEVVASLPALEAEIIGVSTNGACAFAVNGATKGTSEHFRVWVTPGAYTVTCESDRGVTKSRSVIVKSGESTVAMFDWAR